MKALVTGGAGFIGSEIVDQLIARGDEAAIVDNFSTGNRANCAPSAKVIEMDICDPRLAEIFDEEKPDVVVHTAAQVSVSRSVRHVMEDAETNIKGSINLLENCVRCGVAKVIYSASGGTYYGEVPGDPATEDLPPDPISPYGISKLTVEKYLRFYRSERGLNYVTLRYGNVYGPRQDPHGEAGVVAIFSKAMLAGKRPIIFGDGSCLRDYVYVSDVARANLAAIEGPEEGSYNIGTSVATDVNELFQRLAAVIGFEAPAESGPPRPGDLLRSVLNIDRAARELGWAPEMGLDEGLKRTAQFFKDNPDR